MYISQVPRPHLSRGKRSDEPSWISWAYCSIVLVTMVFQHQEMQLSPHRNVQQEQRSLTIRWTAWIVFQPFSCFTKHGLHTYTLPPPRWAHIDKKTGSRLVGQQRRLPKPSIGTHRQGWAANGMYTVHFLTTFSLPIWVAMITACTLTQKPCDLFTGIN